MSTDNDDERYTVSSVRCLPRAYRYHHQRSGPIRPVTGCCFCELFCFFLSPTFSLFLLGHSSHPSISPYLSDCTQAARLPPLVNVTRSRSPTKNLQQWRGTTLATSLRLVTADLVHGQCYTWCESTVEGEAPRVVLDSVLAMLSE